MREIVKRRRVFKCASLWALSSIASIATASAVQAQTPTPAPATQPDQLDDGQLQEIVVTAERREQDLQSTAVAVSVRSGDELLQQGRYSVAQILEDIPGVSIESRSTTGATYDSLASAVVIRGVTTNPIPAGSYVPIVPAVAAYVDGVLNGIGGTYDIGQVQVLRGPQGTLYGRSATSGALVINTTAPRLGEFGGRAFVELGNYDLQHYSAALNVPIGDTIAVRASGDRYRRDGFYARTGGRNSTLDGRVKLLFEPTDNFSATLGFAFQDRDEYSGERNGFLTGLGTDAVSYDTPSSATPLGTGKDRTRQYWGQFDWDFGPATLTYIGARRDYEQDSVSYNAPNARILVTTTIEIPKNTFDTHELRLASNSTSPWRWQAGVFYYRNELDISSQASTNTGVILSQLSPQSRLTRNVGVFAESTYAFSDSTRLTAGLRYDYTKVDMDATACAGPIPLSPDSCDAVSGARTWKEVTYKVRAEHDLSPSNLIYASLSTAFLPGDLQVVNIPPVLNSYEAETLTALEFGTKNRFLDDRLQVNAAAFFYRYGGRQTQIRIGTVGVPPTPLYTLSSAPARMRGGELEVLFQPSRNDLISLNASYTDAYYVNKSELFESGVAQDELANVIPFQANATYRRTFELPNDQELTFNAQAQYRSGWLVIDIPATELEKGFEPYMRNGRTLLINLGLAYKVTPNITLSGNVRNLTDTRYKTRTAASSLGAAVPLADDIRSQAGALSEPRNYSVALDVKF